MVSIIKYTGKASSIPAGLVIAASISMMITVTASATIAHALNIEMITWEQSGYWIMGMLFAASFLGGKTAVAVIKRQKIVVSMMAGVLYWGLLLCITALFFGGRFSAVWQTAAIIAGGCGSAGMLSRGVVTRSGKKTLKSYR